MTPSLASAQGLFEDAVSGEASADPDGESVPSGVAGVELNGYVRGVVFAGPIPDEMPDDRDEWEQKSSYGEASLKLRTRKGDAGQGFAEVRLRVQDEDGRDESVAEVREAYVDVYLGPVDVRFGHQIILWGRADGINPTNNLTPYDNRVRSPNEDDRRIGALGLRTHYNVDDWRFEGVWMPTYTESHYPDFMVTDPMITFGDPDYPGARLSGGLVAARINYAGPALDMSVSYLYGQAPYPGLELRSLTLPPVSPGPVVEVGFHSYRHQVIGFDFAAPVGDWFGLRGEVAYKAPYDYREHAYSSLPEIYYVVGVDREFLNGDMVVIVQYVGKWVHGFEEIESSGLLSGGALPPVPVPPAMTLAMVEDEVRLMNRMIHGQQDEQSHVLFGRIEWKLLHQTLSVDLSGMYNFTTYESMIRPNLSYEIADALDFSLGAEIYQGPEDTLFGLIDESQSAAFVQLKASF